MQQSKYRVLGLVGQGQFGRVFWASNRQTGQIVALKELSHQRSPTNQFLRELWFLISLEHPNIVTCQAMEHTATGRYLVMDYCEGGTLRNPLKQEFPLRLMEALQIVIGVLAGLEYAHRRGIIHCDIKPENILLTLEPRGWVPRLSDFGIARRLPAIGSTQLHQEISPDATIGSPGYMAPERFYGLYSPKSDLYAIGVLLFELLMGYRPFSGMPDQLRWAHLNQRLQLPSVIPECLQNIIKKSLEKLPARRFESAAQMAQVLRKAMYDSQVRDLGDQIIPWGTEEGEEKRDTLEKSQTLSQCIHIRPMLPMTTDESSSPILAASQGYFYNAVGKELKIWQESELRSTATPAFLRVSCPEPIVNLQPGLQGCWVFTKQHLYWLKTGTVDLGVPLIKFEEIVPEGSATPLQQNETIPVTQSPLHPLKLNYFYKVAIDPKNYWLAAAIPGELQFYCLPETNSLNHHPPLLLPKRTIALPTKVLPELLFLDQRHLLTIWLDTRQKHPRTIFRIYTRRGTRCGTIRLSTALGQVLLTPEPYTLLGIPAGFKSAALLIRLWPFQVIRIPLEHQPVCACATNWGCILADHQGQIIILDYEGNQIGSFQGPAASKTMIAFNSCQPQKGKIGLAIATHAVMDHGVQSIPEAGLHLLEVDINSDL